MILLWITVSVTLLASLTVAAKLSPLFRASQLSWRLLSGSGLALGMFGLVWIFRGWDPTSGPYRVAEAYPFGGHLQAWQVTFGFTWMALGLLFFGSALIVAQKPQTVRWILLLVSWLVCLLPHVIIAVSLAWAGDEAVGSADLGAQATAPGALAQIATAAVSAAFLLSSVGGFVWTGMELLRGRRTT